MANVLLMSSGQDDGLGAASGLGFRAKVNNKGNSRSTLQSRSDLHDNFYTWRCQSIATLQSRNEK